MSAGVKVFNPRPSAAVLSSASPPGCLLVSQRSLLTFSVFGSGQKPDIVFPFIARQRHDRCPWKQHLCRCFQLFEDFSEFCLEEVRSIFTMLVYALGQKGNKIAWFDLTEGEQWIVQWKCYETIHLLIIFNTTACSTTMFETQVEMYKRWFWRRVYMV